MRFIPSVYSEGYTIYPNYGDADEDDDKDKKKVWKAIGGSVASVIPFFANIGAGAGAGGAATTTAVATTAAGGTTTALTTAAGPLAAMGPPGWIALGAVAAVTGLVVGVKLRKVSKAQAAQLAKELNFPEAESVPGFVRRILKKPKKWRMRKLKFYQGQLQRLKKRKGKWKKRPGGQRALQVLSLGIKKGPQRLKKAMKKAEARLFLIRVINYVERQDDAKKAKKTVASRKKRRRLAKQRKGSLPASSRSLQQGEFQEQVRALHAAYKQREAEYAKTEGEENFLTREVAGVPTWGWLVGAAIVVGGTTFYMKKRAE
jgi:hypothetical protein